MRKLGSEIETLRREWVKHSGAETANSFVVDTKPIPVVGYRRSKKHSDFDGSAGYGYCAARKMSARHAASQAACAIALLKYFGYKLVVLSTLKGIPVAYELVSAREANASPVVLRRSARMRCTDERKAVEGVLQIVHGSDIYGDKGFIGHDWQQEVTTATGNRIWTIQRENQHKQVSSDLKSLIS